LYGPGTKPPSWPSGYPLVTAVGPAKLRTRAIAFALDGLIMLAASVGVYLVAGAAGAWNLDSEWLRQYGQNPDATPTVPALHVDLNLIVATSAAIAVACVAYAALCWWRLGAMPGQRALGIRVLDFETGAHVSFPAALRRSVSVYGVIGVLMSGYATITFERLATIPLGETGSNLSTYGLPQDSRLAPWIDVIATVLFLGLAWVFVMAVTSISGSMRRGIHDRIAGSIAIAVRRWAMPHAAWGPASGWGTSPGWGSAPGWTQSASPGGPSSPASLPGPGSISGPPPGSAPGPVPGWTPPGTWTPPGHEAPVDWTSPPGLSSPDGGADEEAASKPPGAPPGSVPPWKAPPGVEAQRLAARPGTLVSAPMSRRVGAYLVDSFIIFLFFTGAVAALSPDASVSGAPLTNERGYILGGLAGGAMQLLYFVLSWTYWRGTPGQKLFGLAVVLELDGKAMSPMDALVRWAVVQGPYAMVTIVPFMLAPFVTLGAICWAAFLLYATQKDPDLQGPHDHFLRTRVVVARNDPPAG
jgi:uncharacterized RDD family membrane protein YckC